MKRFLVLISCVALLAFVLALYASLHRRLRTSLPGGDRYLIQVMPAMDAEGHPTAVSRESVERAMVVLEKRLDPEYMLLRPVDQDRIEIQIARGHGKDLDVPRKIEAVKLEFRLVHSQGNTSGYVKMPVHNPEADGEKELLVKNRADLDGKYVTQSFATLDPNNGWMIILKFNAEGAKLFGELTGAHVRERLAVVVDGEVISAPYLNEAISGGSAEISGRFTESSARSLASALESPFENPIIILQSDTVPSQAEQAGQ